MVPLWDTRRTRERHGEERGSFLLDHVPTIPLDSHDHEEKRASIERAVNQLVDEALKRALWNEQRTRMAGYGFDWLPAHAPELVTITRWLTATRRPVTSGGQVLILHPDPPEGSDEMGVIRSMFELARTGETIEILTPRTFASRGGQVQP